MAQENLKPELYIVRPVLWSKSASSVVRSSIDCNDFVEDARSAFDYFSSRSTRVFRSVIFLAVAGLAPVQKPSNDYIKLKIGENWEGGIGAIFREGDLGTAVPKTGQDPFQNRLKIQDLSPPKYCRQCDQARKPKTSKRQKCPG